MHESISKAWAAIDTRKDDAVAFLQALVREPSTLGNERGAQDLVYRKLRSLGIETVMWEPSLELLRRHRAFAPTEWIYLGRPNVTGVIRGTGGGRSLVLNGHIDVVSPEPLWGWTRNPWGAEVVDGRLYGRGAADMKGGIAMMLLAVEGVLAAGAPLAGDLHVETVIEEECTGNGTLACRLRGPRVDAAIIPEPHALSAVVATMGVLWFRVRVRGAAGHVLAAHQAVNAIEKSMILVEALRRLEAEMNQEISHHAFRGLEHPVNLNVGVIQGGVWPSSVPADCAVTCRLSYEPGIAVDVVKTRVEACVAEAAAADPWLSQVPPVVEYYGFQADGSEIASDHPLLEALASSHEAVVGAPLSRKVSTACNDMRYFLCYFDTPATCYGPAGANLHACDEYVDLDSIVAGARTLAHFILHWCNWPR
jgi:acetylornithine deacetylase